VHDHNIVFQCKGVSGSSMDGVLNKNQTKDFEALKTIASRRFVLIDSCDLLRKSSQPRED
jgi:hypothetical protein